MENIELPLELYNETGSESIDFAVKAGRFQPPRNGMILLLAGIAIASFFAAIISPALQSAGNQDENPGISGSVYWIIISCSLALILLIFGLVATGILSKRSGYYAGTSSRFIHYREKRLRSIDWEQFTGDIEVKGTAKRGSIAFKLRTGSFVSGRGFDNRRFVPEVIYFSGIPDVYEIAKICRKRIKENNPKSK